MLNLDWKERSVQNLGLNMLEGNLRSFPSSSEKRHADAFSPIFSLSSSTLDFMLLPSSICGFLDFHAIAQFTVPRNTHPMMRCPKTTK
jgi:hypothetical protein